MKEKKNLIWYKWLALAACVAVVIGISLLISNMGEERSHIGAIPHVTYPKAYAFDDYDAKNEVREQNPVNDSFIETLNDFSFKTGSIILTDTGGNINYSPISLYYALSLATSGAKNDTEAELLDLLGVSNTEILSKQCGNM